MNKRAQTEGFNFLITIAVVGIFMIIFVLAVNVIKDPKDITVESVKKSKDDFFMINLMRAQLEYNIYKGMPMHDGLLMYSKDSNPTLKQAIIRETDKILSEMYEKPICFEMDVAGKDIDHSPTNCVSGEIKSSFHIPGEKNNIKHEVRNSKYETNPKFKIFK